MNSFWNIAIVILLLICVLLLLVVVLRSRRDSGSEQALKQQQAAEQQVLELQRSEENRRLAAQVSESMAGRIGEQVQLLNAQVGQLSSSNEQRLESLRQAVNTEMEQMRLANAKSIEEIRNTVSEKLEGTLQTKLNQSFQQVGERLEQVYRGLGEMQALAAGVGDLQKLLRNVKIRGTWGEVQLGGILEQMLTPAQYRANVAVNPASTERVEYAIALPGKEEGQPMWLPIDSKCPLEDYERLTNAQEAGDSAAMLIAGRALETSIKNSAASIRDKYIVPPFTTDFAILFLPIEGLYAEVLQREGLVDTLQRNYRITVAGPTTLSAMVNSLQMGFRTLAIEQRASEVWQTLGAIKGEFGQFDEVLGKVAKKLQEADNLVDKAQVRSRVMQRKLKDVQELPFEGDEEAAELE